MSNWRFRWRRSYHPPRRRQTPSVPRVEAVPIANIDMLLRAVTQAMNAIPPSDDFDVVLATRLYHTVMCLRKFFPEWGVYLRPIYFGDINILDQRVQGLPETENNSDTEPLISEI